MADDATELVALQDVLGASKWSRALFTTYSLSLGFFEAYLLQRLEGVGCSNITIFVDSEFYLESLSERQARWTGKAYQLLPIGRPGNHIFHSTTIKGKLMESEKLAEQAASNNEKQFDIGDFKDVLTDLVIEGQENHNKIAEQLLQDERLFTVLQGTLANVAYLGFQNRLGQPAEK